MIPVPTRKLLLLFTFPVFLFIPGLFFTPLAVAGILVDAVILLAALLDILPAMRMNLSVSKVQKERVFSIGRENTLALELTNQSNQGFDFQATIDIPEYCQDLTNQAMLSVPTPQPEGGNLSFKTPAARCFPDYLVLSQKKNSPGPFFYPRETEHRLVPFGSIRISRN